MKTSRRVLVVGLCLMGLGCGDGAPKTYPVKGKVTYKNQPLAGAGVTFHPAVAGPLAIGQTNAQGEFDLMTFSAGDGAVAGSYVITVTKSEGVAAVGAAPATPSSDPAAMQKSMEEMAKSMQGTQKGGRPPAGIATAKQLVPAKYGKKESSPLKETVSDSKPNEFTLTVAD